MRDFSAQFSLSLALKDVRLAVEEAGDERFAVLGCADGWRQVAEQGLGDQDVTMVARRLERQGGSR